MKVLSQRAKKFLEQPQFKRSGNSLDFEVALAGGDKILTVFYGDKESDLELIFSEALVHISKNRSALDLWKINSREVESFLRDENHLPATDGDPALLEETLLKMKAQLLAGAMRTKLGETYQILKDRLFHWEKSTLLEKNQWGNTFAHALGWEFIFCDERTLTVTKLPPEAAPNAYGDPLHHLFKSLFGGEQNFPPMKLVAVQ